MTWNITFLVLIAILAGCRMEPRTATTDARPYPVVPSIPVYCVAPEGADTNPGTREQPFASLERARDAVRELKKQPGGLPPGGVKVLMSGGVYLRQATFTLNAEDSGTADSPIVYAAAPGKPPVLYGGTRLDGSWFVPVADSAILERVISPEARRGVVQCDLKSHGITDYGELSRRGHHKANLGKPPPMDLFINGERMTLARWPNPADPPPAELNKHMEGLTGIVCRSAIVDKGPTMDDPDFLTRGGTFAYAFDRPSLWSRADDIWLDGVFAWSWEWSYNKIAAIDTAKKQITLRYGEVSGLQDKYSGNFFFAENLLEEIDLPGEYYIDRAAGRLYLLPPAGFANADTVITVSTLKTPVIEMKGASFITVQGFVLDTGRGGGISCNGGEGNRIDRCEVRNVTGSGVSVNGRNHGVVSCHIHHVGGAGVGLSGGNVDTLEPGGCFAENNHIHHVAWYSKVYTPAIGLGYRSVGNRVSHNKIHDTPHLAIVVYGNDHLIEYNEFYNVAMLFIDMGAIYGNLGATPCERGTVIRRNWFHDIGNVRPLQNGIYPDNNTMGWTIEENVFQRIGGPGATAQSRSIDVNAGAWIITRHNLFVDCSLPYMMNTYSASQEVYDRNKKTWTEYFKTHDLSKLPHARKYPELLRFWDEERQYADSNTFEGNLIYNPTVPLLKKFGKMDMVDGTVDAKKQLRRKDNWVTTEDPGFVDVAAGNLSLRADAPVFSRIPGFPVIPFKEIGLTGPVGPE